MFRFVQLFQTTVNLFFLYCYLYNILYTAVPTCQGKTEGLVYYPTTTAPSSGSKPVNTSCADNAHQVTPSLEVVCYSDGRWSTNTQPQCRCNDGYQQATVKGKLICQGFNIITLSYITLGNVENGPGVVLMPLCDQQ